MYELSHSLEKDGPAADIHFYAGPERRSRAAGFPTHWLAATLDEIDYGMVLLGNDLLVLHANHAARAELDATHPLQLLDHHLRARRVQDMRPLQDAHQGASTRGLRKLLTLGGDGRRISVSVVPLAVPCDASGPITLVMLGKRLFSETLSVQSFASSHGLTATEAKVLVALCQGVSPIEFAEQSGVAISTVRTQIGNIRLKTGAESIRALVQKVATLPPMMSVLRSVPADGHMRSLVIGEGAGRASG